MRIVAHLEAGYFNTCQDCGHDMDRPVACAIRCSACAAGVRGYVGNLHQPGLFRAFTADQRRRECVCGHARNGHNSGYAGSCRHVGCDCRHYVYANA